MFNRKNKSGDKQGCQRIDYQVGITALGDIFVNFSNGEQHFKCTMDEISARKMGEGLIDCANKLEETISKMQEQLPEPEGAA